MDRASDAATLSSETDVHLDLLLRVGKCNDNIMAEQILDYVRDFFEGQIVCSIT
jgi:hypothetical protein